MSPAVSDPTYLWLYVSSDSNSEHFVLYVYVVTFRMRFVRMYLNLTKNQLHGY